MTYSAKIGLYKTLKNTLIVLGPAGLAAWAAFAAKAPPEYAPLVAFVGGFLGYFIKNYKENK